jgi:hypothetical protein
MNEIIVLGSVSLLIGDLGCSISGILFYHLINMDIGIVIYQLKPIRIILKNPSGIIAMVSFFLHFTYIDILYLIFNKYLVHFINIVRCIDFGDLGPPLVNGPGSIPPVLLMTGPANYSRQTRKSCNMGI